MKTLIASVLLFIASTAMADIPNPGRRTDKCLDAAKAVAKMNMDQKAQSYQFAQSDVDNATFVKEIKTKNETLRSYSVGAYIYRANYTVNVTLDSSCGVMSVNIKENL